MQNKHNISTEGLLWNFFLTTLLHLKDLVTAGWRFSVENKAQGMTRFLWNIIFSVFLYFFSATYSLLYPVSFGDFFPYYTMTPTNQGPHRELNDITETVRFDYMAMSWGQMKFTLHSLWKTEAVCLCASVYTLHNTT